MPNMAATAINTLRYARRLKNAGVPHEQAEAMADAIGSELTVELVTKVDLEAATAGLDAGIAKVDGSLAILRTDFDTAISALDTRVSDRIGEVENSLAILRTDIDAAITALEARVNDRIGEVESSLATLRTDIDTAISALEMRVNDRIGKVEISVTKLSADLDTSFSALAAANNERFSSVESSLATMRWMMGFTLAFVVALTWRSFT